MSDEIKERQAEIEQLHAEIFGKPQQQKKIQASGGCQCLGTDELIKIARKSKQGAKLQALEAGDISGYPSQSEADLSLCSILAFWLNKDPQAIDSYFRKTSLFRDDKWDEKHNGDGRTYGQLTIDKAIGGTSSTFQQSYSGWKFTEKQKVQKKNKFSSREVLDYLYASQDGDAELFIQLHYNKYCFDHAACNWYAWAENYWELDTVENSMLAVREVIDIYTDEVRRQTELRILAEESNNEEAAKEAQGHIETLHKKIHSLRSLVWKKHVRELARNGRGSLGISGSEWDRDPYLLGCKNGVVDLRSGNFQPGKQKDYIRTIAPVEWRGIDEKCPLWEKTLSEIFQEDRDLISYIQRLFGYGITGSTELHILPIFWGIGRNGKGTILEFLKSEVLGEFAHKAESELLLEQSYARQAGAPNSSVSALRAKRLVWCSEVSEGRKWDIGRMKELVGGDTLNAREPYGRRNVEFRPQHLLLLLTNAKPAVPSNDYAFWKRIHLIPFKTSFVDSPQKPFERQVDHELPEKLKAEASGVLAWLVRGCLEYQRTGLKPPESVVKATEEYQHDEDVIGQFIEAMCEMDANSQVQGSTLYKAYCDWAADLGIRPVYGKKFGSEMKTRFESYTKKYVFYVGIKLNV